MPKSKKKISIIIPCYNEQENVVKISSAVSELFEKELFAYDYETIFCDNYSQDNTRSLIREICARNKNVKAIFNTRNFGQFNSPFHGMLQASGDCV
jgi:glycosyltransferase involved in cell wall biosynthesis